MSKPAPIPFNRPYQAGPELTYIGEALRGGHASGGGPFTKRCEQYLSDRLGAEQVLLTTSCTHALELCAMLLDLGPGDEVIVPSFTFVSTANAFALRGARPVFADVRADTLNVDETRLEPLITDRTRAIVVVHYAGVGCEMDAIGAIAERHGVPVIEDNAHGLVARYKDHNLGTMGLFGTQSFHETKNFTCGEGGAVVINDGRHAERAEILRDKGTNRARFFRGQVDKYSWVDLGSSYPPADILAAYLLAQLEAADHIQATRRGIWHRYAAALGDWAAAHGVTTPFVPDYCEQSFHMFYLLLPTPAARDRFIQHLAERDILAVFHYVPLHASSMGERFGSADCPVTEDVSGRLVRLPFFADLTEAEQERVIDAAITFRP